MQSKDADFLQMRRSNAMDTFPYIDGDVDNDLLSQQKLANADYC